MNIGSDTLGGGFHEDFANPEADPLARTHEDFPFEEVFNALDGASSTPDGERTAEGLRRLMAWLVAGQAGTRNPKLNHLGARALVMAWTVRPDLLGGQSLTQVAKAAGISPDVMHRTSADFSRTFGYRNHGQSHAWNFKRSQVAPAV